MAEPILRRAVRALLIAEDDSVLLMRVRLPDGSLVWITPGGGLQPDESVEDALHRELREELGLSGVQSGPLVWRRDHTLTWHGRRLCQSEQYFAIRVPRFAPVMSDQTEARTLDQFRWWSLPELRHTSERLTPNGIYAILRDFLRDGAPAEVGHEVIVD